MGETDCGIVADVYSCFTGISEANAELIVTAVNACQKINPDNPMAVAQSITHYYFYYMRLWRSNLTIKEIAKGLDERR